MIGNEDVTRRGFLEFTGATALPLLQSGGFEWDDQATGLDPEVEGYGLLLGPEAARPPAAGEYLSQWDTYNFVYFATDTGTKSFIQTKDADWSEIPMPIPTNQLDEIETQEAISFFNHTFARPEAPDTKNWEFTSSEVTKQNSEVELDPTTVLETTQRGNYPPGGEATPGLALRLTGTPTAGEGFGGYATANDGLIVGEDTTDSFVEIRKSGTTHRVYRKNWNGFVPNDRVWVDSRPIITRMPHLFYGGGDLGIEALLHGSDGSRLRRLHTFTADSIDDAFADGATIDQPNLPVRFESDSLSGGAVRANACHYQFELNQGETRINGHTFDGVSVGSTGWTPLIAWRKRSGWDMVNVKPLKIKVAASSNDVRLELQLDAGISLDLGESWALPPNTSSSETAVEFVENFTITSNGERRWVGYASAGQGSQSGEAESDQLDFNLAVDRVVVLAAQGVGGTADVSGVVGLEEFF